MNKVQAGCEVLSGWAGRSSRAGESEQEDAAVADGRVDAEIEMAAEGKLEPSKTVEEEELVLSNT